MAYEKKNYDFTLYINDNAVGTRPAVSGSIFINGEEIPLAGWLRTTKTGKQVYSGCRSVKREQKPSDQKDGWETHNAENDIPF